MKKKRFLGLIIIAFSLFVLIGCGKKPVVEFWNSYVEAVNSQNLDAVSSKFAITPETAQQYKDSHADYFTKISKIETNNVTVVTECYFSSKLYTNNYYLLLVDGKVNGESMKFNAYIREENNGMLFCSDFDFSNPKALGNKPDDLWLKSAFYTNSEYQFKFSEDLKSTTFVKVMKNPKEFVVPEKIGDIPVTTIYNYAFYKTRKILSFTVPNSKLRKVTLPETIININDYAFYQCTKLKEITIPSKVAYIGVLAFAGCRSLETIRFTQEAAKLKEPLEERTANEKSEFEIFGGRDMLIGDIITLSSNLTSVTWSTSGTNAKVDRDTGRVTALAEGSVTISGIGIDSNKKKVQGSITINIKPCPVVTKINFDALDRLPKLRNIYIYATNPNAIVIQNGTNKFSLSTKVKIYVPYGTSDLYKANNSWSSYSDQIIEME